MTEDITRAGDITKASLLCGEGFFSTRDMSGYGLRSLKLLDGGTGLNFEQLFGDLYRDRATADGYSGAELDNVVRNFFSPDKLTEHEKLLYDMIESDLSGRTGDIPVAPGCYPPGILLGSTWDPDTVYEVGAALGMEAAAYKIDCLLGTPNLNILREPRNGRFFEGISEDPFLTSKIAVSEIEGVQSRGVAANAKHYAANNLEINRAFIDQHISERALREIYLPGFIACAKAGVRTVMAAYPKINGVSCTENRYLLRDILKGEAGFEGVIMTDWCACNCPTGTSAAAGVDLFMPGPWPCEDIAEAVKDGRLSESELDDSVSRMSSLIRYCDGQEHVIDPGTYIEEGDRAAYRAAAEGIVMLKNRGGAFPFEDTSRYVVFGAGGFLDHGGGSAQVFTSRRSDIVSHLPGCRCDDIGAVTPDSAVIVICTVGSAEGSDRSGLGLPEETAALLDKILEREHGITALILNTPGPVELGSYIDRIDAVFACFYPGMQGGAALADILTGRISPSGKLPFTWPVRYEDTPAFLCYPDSGECTYGEGIFVGYRGYEKRGLAPQFPFGYGLTYSGAEIVSFTCSGYGYEPGDRIELTAVVRNTGTRDVREVLQIYVSDPVSRVIKPVKELCGFTKFDLPAGETVTVTVTADTDDFRFWSEDLHRFALESGIYLIHAGFSSDDIRCSVPVLLHGGDPEFDISINSPLRWIAGNSELIGILKNDIISRGLELQVLVDTMRYAPHQSVSDIYPESGTFTSFIEACGKLPPV